MSRDREPVVQSSDLQRVLGKAPVAPAREHRIATRALSRLDDERRPAAAPRWALGAAAAVACAAALLLARTRPEQAPAAPPVPVRAEAPREVVEESGEATRVVAIGAHQLRLGAGTRLQMKGLDPDHVGIDLEAGSVAIVVSPLRDRGSFQVRAGPVTVEVVGTRFGVDTDGTCAQVSVSEGKVRVISAEEGERLLGAGDEASVCRAPDGPETEAEGEELVREALRALGGGRGLERAAALLSRYVAQYPRGELTEEALYQLALIKARQGLAPATRYLVESFAAKFPRSARTRSLRERTAQVLAASHPAQPVEPAERAQPLQPAAPAGPAVAVEPTPNAVAPAE